MKIERREKERIVRGGVSALKVGTHDVLNLIERDEDARPGMILARNLSRGVPDA